MALEETGVRFVTEGESAFEGALSSASDAVSGFGGIVGSVSSGVADAFDQIVIGALRRVGEMAVDTFFAMGQAAIQFGADSFQGALDAEVGLARFDAALRASESAAKSQQDAWEAAQGKVVTVGQITGDALQDLQQDYRLTEIAIAEQQSKLDAIAEKNGTVNTEYEKQSIVLQRLQEKLAGYSAQLSGAAGAQVDLAAAMGLVPPEARLTREELLALADQYKNLAGGSDDAVIAAEAVLLKFHDIGKDNFEGALQASLDLAAVLGTSVPAAAEQLGRALENTEASARLLKSAGIFLTDAEKKMLKQFEETGKSAEAQQFILDKLQSTIGGTADALAKTAQGEWNIFIETIADAGETIAGAFIPILSDLFEKYIKPNLPVIEDLADTIARAFDVMATKGSILESIFAGLSNVFYTLSGLTGLTIFDDIGDSLSKIPDVIPAVVEFFTVTLPSIVSGVLTALQPIIDGFMNLKNSIVDSWPQIQTTLAEMGAAITSTFNAISPEVISNLGGSLDQVALFWQNHSDTVLAIVKVLWNTITLTVGGALVLITASIETGLIWIVGLMDSWSLMFQGKFEEAAEVALVALVDGFSNIGQAFDTIFNSILLLMGTNLEEFRALWQNNFDMLNVITYYFTDQIYATFINFIGKTADAIALGWMGIINTTIKSTNDLISKLGNFAADFVKIGQAWIDGIVNGIMQKVGYLQNTVIQSIKDTMDKARETLGIASPSKVAADLIGQPFAEGIAQGILQGANAINGAIGGVIGQMIAPPAMAAQMVSPVSSATNIYNNFNNSVSGGVDVEMLTAQVVSRINRSTQ